jgi:aryl-alcohol dehydrogenase-like predicted oxidoreductase
MMSPRPERILAPSRRTFLGACAAAISAAVPSARTESGRRVRFGQTDLHVSRICEGTAFRVNKQDPRDANAQAVLRRCLDSGINFFDSSNAYSWGGAEAALGKAIAGHRHELILCTKVHPARKPEGAGPAPRVRFTLEFARREIQGSLKRLGTDYVDLYLLHNPDPQSTIAEVAGIMIELVRAGYARYWGVSNHSPEQVLELVELGKGQEPRFRVAAIQNRYSIVRRGLEASMFPVLRATGLGAMLFSPLDEGRLLRADPVGNDPRRSAVVTALDATARLLGATRAQILIAWVLAHPEATCALAGAETPRHVDENIGGIGLKLPAAAVAALDAASKPLLGES